MLQGLKVADASNPFALTVGTPVQVNEETPDGKLLSTVLDDG